MSHRLDTDEAPETLDTEVLQRLGSKKAAQREAAEALIEGLGAFAPDALIAALRRERERRSRRRRWVAVGLALYVALMILLVVTGHARNLGSFTGVVSALIAATAASQAQKNATRKLAEFEDVRAAGFLLEALEFNDKQLAGIAAAKLTVLLPRLKASDAALLTDDQRACLHRQLGKRRLDREAPLLLAMLKALEQIGDERSVPAVRALAEKPGSGEAAARVRAAAREALPAVEKSAERWRNAATLLRPADASAAPDDTLLRPAAGAQTADDAEHLLRPSPEETS